MGKERGSKKPGVERPPKAPKVTGTFFDCIGGKFTGFEVKKVTQPSPGPIPFQ